MKLKAFLIIGIVLLAIGVVGSKAHAAGGPTVYASFSGQNASGLVEVSDFGSSLGSQVIARIKSPSSGVVGFCLTRANGSRTCSTVNPTNSSFDKSSKGCATFTITFGEIPTRVEIFDANFITSFASADLTTTAPPNLGYLNVC